MRLVFELVVTVMDDPENEKKRTIASRLMEAAEAEGYRIYEFGFKEVLTVKEAEMRRGGAMQNENGWMVYPVGMVFYNLDAAKDAARLDSTTSPAYKARVEDVDTNETVAVYIRGEEVEP